MSQKKLLIDDEKDKHPFYSDDGIKKWQRRLKDIMKEEESWTKRKRVKEVENDSEVIGNTHSIDTTGDTSLYAGEAIQSVDKPKKRRKK